MTEIEERLAHLMKQSDELSDEVARHAAVIDRLEKQVAFLMTRARDDGEGGVFLGDERPPHW